MEQARVWASLSMDLKEGQVGVPKRNAEHVAAVRVVGHSTSSYSRAGAELEKVKAVVRQWMRVVRAGLSEVLHLEVASMLPGAVEPSSLVPAVPFHPQPEDLRQTNASLRRSVHSQLGVEPKASGCTRCWVLRGHRSLGRTDQGC